MAERQSRLPPGYSHSAIVPGLERLVRDALSDAKNTLPATGYDGLRLVGAPLVPEVRLFLAEDAVVLWARLEAVAGHALPAPFWASAWTGGQALARHILDHPAIVAGRRVLDIASGSGLVAIAAAIAGAASVTANDVDPYAVAAIGANADANRVALRRSASDLLEGDGDGAEVVLAGDVLYNQALADRMVRYFARIVAGGGRVLVGDPDRGKLPHDRLTPVATYHVSGSGLLEDAQRTLATVYAAELVSCA
jgi:predicted nicotinamide N-methyase